MARPNAAEGPPVLLFPSLAGSVLECRQSPVPGFAGQRIWMSSLDMMISSTNSYSMEVQDPDERVSLEVSQPFVQHIMLQPRSDGQDVPGFEVRPQEGLAGCEYLSESALMKDGTVIMGVISDMLREHGYSEWDGTQGSMIGCSYDWRLAPAALEARDRFFSRMADQLEAMVQANGKPAVLIGFSLGCRIGKYLLHFCQAQRGREWVDQHIQHFVTLGGPWLGAVTLLRSVLVDGAFPPLDVFFTESQMLTIMRSVPVGRYLQPIRDWADGLDTPFVYVRDETFLRIEIGGLTAHRLRESSGDSVVSPMNARFWNQLDSSLLQVEVNGVVTKGEQTLSSFCRNPFAASVSFALESKTESAHLRVVVLSQSSEIATGEHTLYWGRHVDAVAPPSGQGCSEQGLLLSEALSLDLGCHHCCQSYGNLELRAKITSSEGLSDWGSPWMPKEDHPLAAHNGGTPAEWQASCRAKLAHSTSASLDGYVPDGKEPIRWKPARAAAVQEYDDVYLPRQENWQVPGPDGGLVDDTVAPPVRKLTAVYGVNVPTTRTFFLRHKKSHWSGGATRGLSSAFVLDSEGDVDGLIVIDGVGYETSGVAQIRPDNEQEQVFTSGDGTVNYQSLRHAATWRGALELDLYELPGCDHRGVSVNKEMLNVLRGVLELSKPVQKKVLQEKLHSFEEKARERYLGCTKVVTNNCFCSVMAKMGFRAMNVYRATFRHLTASLVILCLAVLTLVLAAGVSLNYDFVNTCSWASARLELLDEEAILALSPTFGAELIACVNGGGSDINLGMLTYAYRSNLLSGGHCGARCTYSYSKGKDLPFTEGQTYLEQVSETCDAGLLPDTCNACYKAGTVSITVIFVTILNMIMVFVGTMLRSVPNRDSRMRKFLILPWVAATITGSLLAYSRFYSECYLKLYPDLTHAADQSEFAQYLKIDVHLNTFSFAIIFCTLCSILILILQMVIPVPEVYQTRCLDPETIESRPNSLRARDDALLLQVPPDDLTVHASSATTSPTDAGAKPWFTRSSPVHASSATTSPTDAGAKPCFTWSWRTWADRQTCDDL